MFKVLGGTTVKIANLSKHEKLEIEKHRIKVAILPDVEPSYDENSRDDNVTAIPVFQWFWAFNLMDVDSLTRKEIDLCTDSILDKSAIERFTYLIRR